MLTSQLLLTLFVLYWLQTQYRIEKERLVNELTGLYTETQNEIIDTLLFRSYVNPVLSHPESVRVEHRPGSGNMSNDTTRLRKINDEMILRSVKLIISHSKDTSNRKEPLIRYLLNNPDTGYFKKNFHERLRGAGMKFNISFDDNKASADNKNRTDILYVNSLNPLSLPAVSVTHYKGYLTGKILPQILFGVSLILITALAFWLSFRSIRNHIILNSLRNEFISNMTHELKTPVATLSVALESLGKYNMRKEPAVMDEYLKLASLETKRLEDLISRVLDHSLLEENNQFLNLLVTDINPLITEVAAIMRQRLEGPGTIDFLPSVEKISILGDPLFLKGVLINLLDNSIKYCDKVPVIKIVTRKDKGSVVIEVADNGPGIPAEYQKRIFEKFFRLPSGNVHNVKGYGLGLSFASLVIKLHKGSISVRNNNVGCTFFLKIPAV